MTKATKPGRMLIAGEWVEGASTFTVVNKFTGDPVAVVSAASREQVSQAVHAATSAFERQRLAPYTRYEILRRASDLLESRRAEFIATIVAESGFTVTDAEGEVARGIQTLLLCAEEAKRMNGEVVPIRDPQATAEAILKWADLLMSDAAPPRPRIDVQEFSFDHFQNLFLGQLQRLGLL